MIERMPPSALRVAGAVVRTARHRSARLILIDGPSGAGKSTLADAVSVLWPSGVDLVRLDEVYQGWCGLAGAPEILRRELLEPWKRGDIGRVPRWDWEEHRPRRPRHVRPGHPLLVEGCGAFAVPAPSAWAGVLRVWVEAPDALRRSRALIRDGGAFDPYWEMWERQWRAYTARTTPRRSSDLRVRLVDE